MATAFGYTVQTGTDAELLLLYRAALAAISQGQSYQFGDKQLTRADLKEVREMITWLEDRVAAATLQGPAENVARMK